MHFLKRLNIVSLKNMLSLVFPILTIWNRGHTCNLNGKWRILLHSRFIDDVTSKLYSIHNYSSGKSVTFYDASRKRALPRERAPERDILPRVLDTVFYNTTAKNIIITNKLEFKNLRASLLVLLKKCVTVLALVFYCCSATNLYRELLISDASGKVVNL